MKKNFKLAGIISAMCLIGVFLFAEEIPSVTVAGFINLGKPADSTINIMITKSLITFLSKVSEGITPYENSLKAAEENGFFTAGKMNPETAILIAQTFGSERVIAGDYLVNDKDQTIAVNVYVYDVITGKLKLQRSYSGPIGLDLFDTIDKIIRDVTGLVIGKAVELGKLKVAIENSTNSYELFINDKPEKNIDSKVGFEDEYVAGRTVRVMLKSKNTGNTVLVKSVLMENRKNHRHILYSIRHGDGESNGGRMRGLYRWQTAWKNRSKRGDFYSGYKRAAALCD